jgi:ubiquinone/menaquinone biosynthesis C-methylase UbiE
MQMERTRGAGKQEEDRIMTKCDFDKEETSILRVFQSRDETRAFYNKISKVYDLLSERSEAPARRAGLDLLAAEEGERILEIGFGTGHCLLDLARAVGPSGAVLGLDLSEGMMGQAEALMQREGLADRVELKRGDAVSLPYDSGSLDGVFMSFTLELFDTPEIPTVLGECRRVLRSGGRLVVVGMSKESDSGFVVHAFEWSHRHFPNFIDCRPIFVRKSLSDAGFLVGKSTSMHIWVPVEVVIGMKM